MRLWLVLLLAFGANAVCANDWQNPQYITDSFVRVALRNEYQADSKYHMVRKWRKPIRVFVDTEVGDNELHRQLVGVQMRHLSSITGHRIGFAQTKDDANMFVIFTQRSKMQSSLTRYNMWKQVGKNILADAACVANIVASKKGSIRKSIIHIPEDSTRAKGLFLNCIIEEMTQAMGLLNDSEKVFPSVFNDKSTDRFLTGLDFLLLKMLYHPNIITGMKEEEVRALSPRILASFTRLGLVRSAQREVHSHSLQKWLDQ